MKLQSALFEVVARGVRVNGEASDPVVSSPSSTAAFKRIVNLDRVVSDETVRPAFSALGLAKKRFHVAQPALPANKRTETPSVKFVRRRLDDVSWRCG
jgi:hypothetical protein